MSKAKPKPEKAQPEIELEPDAWQRLERFIKDVAKTPPKHRQAKKPDEEKAG